MKLVINEYIGIFYRKDSIGRWRKWWCVGNAEIALDIADHLKKLGHKVALEDHSNDGRD